MQSGQTDGAACRDRPDMGMRQILSKNHRSSTKTSDLYKHSQKMDSPRQGLQSTRSKFENTAPAICNPSGVAPSLLVLERAGPDSQKGKRDSPGIHVHVMTDLEQARSA